MFVGPSNLRFKRYHKKKVNFHSAEGSFFCNKFGVLGLQSREGGYLNAKQIEAVRRALRRGLKDKYVRIKINVYPQFSRTKKPVSSRMGKGKGKHAYGHAAVKQGQVLFELSQFAADVFVDRRPFYVHVLSKAMKKLPFKSRIVELKY